MFVTPLGQPVRCSAAGWGVLGASTATSMHSQCITDMQKLGALPIDEAGFIGIQISSAPPGTKVLQVYPGSPAFKAGIRPGDTITHINNIQVKNTDDLKKLIFGKANTSVRVSYTTDNGDRDVWMIRAPKASFHENAIQQ